MPLPIEFRYFLYDLATPVTHRHKRWRHPLPQNKGASDSSPVPVTQTTLTYGDYFKAARSYIEKNRFEPLLYALFCLKQEERSVHEIEEVRIILSKHGEFYHPSKIEVFCKGKRYALVLNMAISSPGKAVIEQEFGVLDTLRSTSFHHYVPEVYGFGKIPIGDGMTAFLFLGQWFEGYHEFHASQEAAGRIRTRLWDTDNGHAWVSPEDAGIAYRKIAKILTAFYDVNSFRQVFPWHHAAGDFILKKEPQGMDMKLITARQYEAMIEPADLEDPDFRNFALLVFLLNLSIRMRLDRLDGTGKMVWLDDFLVQSTVSGFLDGLNEQEASGLLTRDWIDAFFLYLKTREAEEIIETAMAIVDSYHPKAPERRLIQAGIQTHLALLIDVLGK